MAVNPAAATSTGDAVEDILMGGRFQGAMSTVTWLTDFIDQYFIMFISIVAFFIISGALLRNVIAGAYAAFPKFWDGISEAKETLQDKQLNIGGRDVSILLKITAFFFPDLKKLSDFHDNNIEPKDYFLKAIPKMVAIVMIGVVIYNGLYRDAIAKTSTFGSELISRLILNVDPVATFDKVFQNASRPDFATADDNSDMGKNAEKVSKEIYSSIVTYWTDVSSKSAKSALTQNIETWVLERMSEAEGFWDSNNYRIRIQVDRVLGPPDLSRLANGDNEIVTTKAWSTPVETFNFESSLHSGEQWHIRFIARFEKIPEKSNSSRTLSNLTLTVPSVTEAAGGKIIVTLNPGSSFKGNLIKVGGNEAKFDPNTGKLEFQAPDGWKSSKNPLTVSGLSYTATDDKGVTGVHSVRSITIGGSAQTLSQGDIQFKVGEGPNFNSKTEEAKQ